MDVVIHHYNLEYELDIRLIYEKCNENQSVKIANFYISQKRIGNLMVLP